MGCVCSCRGMGSFWYNIAFCGEIVFSCQKHILLFLKIFPIGVWMVVYSVSCPKSTGVLSSLPANVMDEWYRWCMENLLFLLSGLYRWKKPQYLGISIWTLNWQPDCLLIYSVVMLRVPVTSMKMDLSPYGRFLKAKLFKYGSCILLLEIIYWINVLLPLLHFKKSVSA